MKQQRTRSGPRRPLRANPQEAYILTDFTAEPTMVLVLRFDPTGETLSRWEVLARDAECDVAFLSPPKARAAALAPSRDADLNIGDLIATVPAEAAAFPEKYATGLFVVAPDGVKAAPMPPEDLGGPWLATWGQNARKMLGASEGVNRKRLVMAACDCAETVLHLVPGGEERPRIAIEMARAWCFGRASLNDVRSASNAALAAFAAATADAALAAFAAATAADADADAAAATAADADTAADAAATADAATADAAAASAAAATANLRANGTSTEATYRALAPLVERWIPLPVVLLSRLGYPRSIPFNLSMVPVGPRG